MLWRHFIVVSLLLLTAASPASADEIVHRVLILNSYHQGMHWVDQQVAGIRDALKAEVDKLEIYIEHLDAKRTADSQFLEPYRRMLALKNEHIGLDAIVSTDNDAFAFIKTYRDDLFGRIPVVFSGINFYRDAMLADFPLVSGVAETFDSDGTLALMRRLHPEAERIVIILDATTTGKILREELESVVPAHANAIRIEFWDQGTLPETLQRLGELDAGDLVLLMPYARDSAGRYITYAEIAEQVSRFAPVPVYGAWDFFLGHGIVGGKLTTSFAQGRGAGRILAQVLNGNDIDTIPVQRIAPTEYQFDKRQLRRFDISESDLPQGSRVLYRSWFDENVYMLGAATVLSLLIPLLLWALWRKVREKRRVVQQLLESETRFRVLFETSPDPVWIIADNRFVDCNQAALAMLGYTEKQALMDAHPADLSPQTQPDGQSSVIKAEQMIAFARENGVNRFEWVHKKADASTFWAEVTLSQVMLQDGAAIYCAWRDISQRKANEEFIRRHSEMLEQKVVERTAELQEAMLNVELANAEKSRFLVNMSHELRTPMHAIMSFAHLGLKHAQNPRVRRFLDNIQSSGERLMVLLNDLLDLSKLESGQMPFAGKTATLEPLIAGAIAELQPLAREKRITVSFDAGQAHEGHFETAMMTRVFINLLSNAIKFSSHGSMIRVEVASVGNGPGGDRGRLLRISVIDSGVGIPQDQLEAVFDKFVQSKLTRSQSGGTGLGLSICKEIVELHHGTIRAESPPAGESVGTAMHVTLPTTPTESRKPGIIRAVKSHERWRNMVEAIVQNKDAAVRLPDSAAANDTICPIGKWLAKASEAASPESHGLGELKIAHRQLHQLAANMIALHAGGDKATAITMLPEFRAASDDLLRQIRTEHAKGQSN
jgi:PAS domain S-box-containing protein